MQKNCPYCVLRPADTEEHIFPQFLGGRKTIYACRQCNSTFGHSFEGQVHRDLIPISSMLNLCGLNLPNSVLWVSAVEGEDGQLFDFDTQRCLLKPSRPIIKKHLPGEFCVVGNKKQVLAITKDFIKRHPKAIATHEDLTKDIPLPEKLSCTLALEVDIRRLAVKMCVALIEYCSPGLDVIDSNTRSFLLGDSVAEIPVRLAYYDYAILRALRKPLSHSIYVEGSSQKGAYGIVQFFGCIQFYVVLNQEFDAPAFSFFSSLNAPEWKEQFVKTELLSLKEAPKVITVQEQSNGIRGWLDYLNVQIKDTFGTNKYLF